MPNLTAWEKKLPCSLVVCRLNRLRWVSSFSVCSAQALLLTNIPAGMCTGQDMMTLPGLGKSHASLWCSKLTRTWHRNVAFKALISEVYTWWRFPRGALPMRCSCTTPKGYDHRKGKSKQRTSVSFNRPLTDNDDDVVAKGGYNYNTGND